MPQSQKATFEVRQVSRGFWTYDIYPADYGLRPAEYSVGECHSRREAERNARAAVKEMNNAASDSTVLPAVSLPAS